jgi:hypothetical protein
MPWTFAGKLKTIQNKTIRYPGTFAQLRAFYDLGLWQTDPVRVGEQEVVPRDLFHALFVPRVTYPSDRDVVAIRIRATGRKGGRPAEAILELVDLYDETTGFTAMERTTGWDGAIVAAMMARGPTPRGRVPVELAVPPDLFVEEMRRRGFPDSGADRPALNRCWGGRFALSGVTCDDRLRYRGSVQRRGAGQLGGRGEACRRSAALRDSAAHLAAAGAGTGLDRQRSVACAVLRFGTKSEVRRA